MTQPGAWPVWDAPPESTMDPDGASAALGQFHERPPGEAGEVYDQLGRGAGGVVLRGQDRHLPRMVAWKVAHGAKAKARLAHEAQALAALEHPAIVAIHDLVEGQDDSLRIALRMVRGETLHTLIRRAPDLSARLRLLRPFLQAVEAVAWAHRVGWVHRDLKPANIMIGEFGETQVIDWGLAENLDDPVDPPGTVVGTLGMMSPEQARGESVSTTFDVWGLGATLFELLAGQPLHPSARAARPGAGDPHSDAEALGALVERVRRGEHPRLSTACPDAPRELAAIVERCLAPAEEDRYPDARALAVDLAAYLDGRQVRAHDYTALELAVRFAKTWRLPLGILCAMLVTGAIAAVLAFDRIGDERDQALRASAEARAAVAARDQQIANGGIIEARRALADDQRPEAELAAARTLEVRESPEARGVIMAFGATPRFERRWSRPLPFDCVDVGVSPGETHRLCGNRDVLTVLDEGGSRWSRVGQHRAAVFIDEGEAVLVANADGSHEALATRTGASIQTHAATDCIGRLVTDPQQSYAVNLGHSCADLFQGSTRRPVDPCAGAHIEVLAVFATPGGPRIAALCMGGDLVVIEPDGARRRSSTEIGPAANTLLSAAFSGPEALIVGSSRGELSVLDLKTSRVTLRRKLPGADPIRSIAVSPERDHVLITSEGRGPLVAAASTLAPIGHLPHDESLVVALATGDTDVITYGKQLSGWSLPAGPPSRLHELGGITSAHHDGERLVVTHDASALVLDPADGAVLARATWDGVVAKHALLEGGVLKVAIAGRTTGEPLLESSSTARPPIDSEELAAMRRVFPLDGGRRLGGRTGLGLVYWPTPESEWVKVVDRLVTELAVRGRYASVLYHQPREAMLYDLQSAPVLLGRCPTPSASSVSIASLAAGDPEPVILAVTPSAIIAYRADDPDRDTGLECPIVARYSVPGGELVRAVATHDDRYVAGGTRDGQVHVWHLDGSLVATAVVHDGAVTTLSADPAGRWLVSGAWDGRLNLLALDSLVTPRATLVTAIRSAWSRPGSAR